VTAPALPGTVKKMGPGVLTIGSAGAPLDFSGRCTKAAVTWKVDTSDDVAVLSGDTIAGDRTYTATLEATVYQDDLTAGGLVDYSWAHKGETVPFTFQPYAGGRVGHRGADHRPARRRWGRRARRTPPTSSGGASASPSSSTT
jgi:hypothetical protein